MAAEMGRKLLQSANRTKRRGSTQHGDRGWGGLHGRAFAGATPSELTSGWVGEKLILIIVIGSKDNKTTLGNALARHCIVQREEEGIIDQLIADVVGDKGDLASLKNDNLCEEDHVAVS
ncbi:MAG: hypothetical protein ACK549_10750, partial [Cyanobacteriota bacterium]